jgi:hypothetical protein
MVGLIAHNPAITIFMELWPKGLREAGTAPWDFVQQLERMELHIWHMNPAQRLLEKLANRDLLTMAERHGYANVLLTRSSRLRQSLGPFSSAV